MPVPEAAPILVGDQSLRPHIGRLAGTAGIVVAGVVGYGLTPLVGERSWLGAVLAAHAHAPPRARTRPTDLTGRPAPGGR